MLLNQQVQGILYQVFESKSVLKVYIFKRSANGANNKVKNSCHIEMMSKVDNCRTQLVFDLWSAMAVGHVSFALMYIRQMF